MLVGATLLTSCEKLEELITGIGDEDDSEDEDGMGSDLEPSTPEEDTSDGEAPYFRFKTDTLYLPAYQDAQQLCVGQRAEHGGAFERLHWLPSFTGGFPDSSQDCQQVWQSNSRQSKSAFAC